MDPKIPKLKILNGVTELFTTILATRSCKEIDFNLQNNAILTQFS